MVSTLCIWSIRKVEIHADIFSWRLAVVQRAVRMNDIARWVSIIYVSDPWVSVCFHKIFGCWVAVNNVVRQFWVTITLTSCITVKTLKANLASAVSELDIQIPCGKHWTFTRTVSKEFYCFIIEWREHTECYIATVSPYTLCLLSFTKTTNLWS